MFNWIPFFYDTYFNALVAHPLHWMSFEIVSELVGCSYLHLVEHTVYVIHIGILIDYNRLTWSTHLKYDFHFDFYNRLTWSTHLKYDFHFDFYNRLTWSTHLKYDFYIQCLVGCIVFSFKFGCVCAFFLLLFATQGHHPKLSNSSA